MTQVAFFVLALVSTFYALVDWRKGLLLMILVGALQDPVRKMMPGAPGYMVLAFVPIWFAVCASVLFSGNSAWSRFMNASSSIANGIQLLGFSLGLAFLVLLINYGFGAIAVGLIGLMGYLFPVLAIAVGYYYIRKPTDLQIWIKGYCVITAVLLTGGLLQSWNLYPDWSALGTTALGTTWIKHLPGHVIELTSGFYRSPDLLGWHSAMLVMLAFLMALGARKMPARVLWFGLVIWGASILLISGRNKMIYMPLIFIAVYALVHLYKGNFGQLMKIATAGVVVLSIFLTVNAELQTDDVYLVYSEAGSTDVAQRVKQSGFTSVWVTYRQSGFFGEGLGTASSGAQYGSALGIKSWQESGLSKLMVELGVIGFLAVMVFASAIGRTLWHLMKSIPRSSPQFFVFSGLLGLMAANSASFLISHQAFGDPFLVTITGFLLGVTLSASRWSTSLRARSL